VQAENKSREKKSRRNGEKSNIVLCERCMLRSNAIKKGIQKAG
jgi:hypothetical protein